MSFKKAVGPAFAQLAHVLNTRLGGCEYANETLNAPEVRDLGCRLYPALP